MDGIWRQQELCRRTLMSASPHEFQDNLKKSKLKEIDRHRRHWCTVQGCTSNVIRLIPHLTGFHKFYKKSDNFKHYHHLSMTLAAITVKSAARNAFCNVSGTVDSDDESCDEIESCNEDKM